MPSPLLDSEATPNGGMPAPSSISASCTQMARASLKTTPKQYGGFASPPIKAFP